MSAMPPIDTARIEALLQAALAPTALTVVDDSAAHAGHAGAGSGGHYTVHIVAAAFAGQSRIARHRLVYDALAPQMRQGIHALAVVAKAPGEGPAITQPTPDAARNRR